jgi:thiamine pyrophosphokinase
MSRPVVIFAGGDSLPRHLASLLPEGAFVIAADSGLDHALAMNVGVDLLIGDLDSVSEGALARYGDGPVERHPVDKEMSDLELAVRYALRQAPPSILVVGGGGGRLDHLLANTAVITGPDLFRTTIAWYTGTTRIHIVRDRIELSGEVGDLLTLLPCGGDAGGITTTGLAWPLLEDNLALGTTRGLSNVWTDSVVTVNVGTGALMAIHTPSEPISSG